MASAGGAKEDQDNEPGWVSKCSPALGDPVITDSQSTNVAAGGMPASDGDTISLPAVQQAAEA